MQVVIEALIQSSLAANSPANMDQAALRTVNNIDPVQIRNVKPLACCGKSHHWRPQQLTQLRLYRFWFALHAVI